MPEQQPTTDSILDSVKSFLLPELSQEDPIEYCEYTKNTDTEEKGVYASLAIVSMTASIFVAWTIFYNKKLRQHPSSLIGYMALCEGISCFNALVWAVNPLDYICYLKLHIIFSWTIRGL